MPAQGFPIALVDDTQTEEAYVGLVSINRPLPVEGEGHLRVESGDTYVHNGIHLTLGTGASLYHLLRVGAKHFHLTVFHATTTTAPIYLELSESPTLLTDGTVGVFLNKKRGSAKSSSSTVFENSTLTSRGLHLEGDLITGAKQDGGTKTGIDEQWLLAPNTDYLFSIDNNSNGDVDVNFHLEGYEEDEH